MEIHRVPEGWQFPGLILPTGPGPGGPVKGGEGNFHWAIGRAQGTAQLPVGNHVNSDADA